MTITLFVDDQELTADAGSSLLDVCLANGIHVPNLCHMPSMPEPRAACRLCFVEIVGEPSPRTACTTPAREGMRVRTDTDAVRSLQRTALRLLLSVHDLNCRECPANRRCALQRLARFLKIPLKPSLGGHYLKEPAVDHSHPMLDHFPNRCVLCGRCIETCRQLHGRSLISFARRGFETVVAMGGVTDATCSACVTICPVGALTLKDGTIPD